MKNKKNLLKKQEILFTELTNIGPFIRGSLVVVKRICGNKNCQCRKNPDKKHPAMFLTWKENKKTKAIYILVSRQEEAIRLNENYKKLKKILNDISNIQKELLNLR